MRVSVPMTVSVDVGAPDPALDSKQRGRLFQVCVAGPLMIYGGAKAGGVPGVLLALLGGATMIQKGRHYLADRQLAQATVNLPAAPPST